MGFALSLAISQISFSVHDRVMVLLERNCAFVDCQNRFVVYCGRYEVIFLAEWMHDGNCFARDLNDIKLEYICIVETFTKYWNFLLNTIIITVITIEELRFVLFL